MINFDCIPDVRQNLAEGPVWSPAEGALYWVDIRKPAVHRYKPPGRTVTTWAVPDLVGSLAIRKKGGVLVALKGRLAVLDPSSGQIEPLVSIDLERPDNRCNDGKCDRRGRFWVGTMDNLKRGGGTGSLYCFNAEHELSKAVEGIEIPNSLAWSPDDKTMYFADTFRRQIYAYDFDLDRGRLGDRRTFAEFGASEGAPDGSTVDADGFLWTAVYRGGALHRYAPDGRLDRVVKLPMSQPTSCAFGGAGLDVLYVTSASQNLTADELAREPYAGAIIAINVGARGLEEPRFAG
jgi:sugar lactone lactonase YvrE